MTKEDVIKKAWGDYYKPYKHQIDENGLLSERFLTNGQLKELNDDLSIEIYRLDTGYYFYRPKSLQGIENNNGWIKIESEEDLPKENIDCFFYDKALDAIVTGYYSSDYNRFSFSGFIIEWNKDITHYQPIEKPKLPIF